TDFDRYLASGQIDILEGYDWYLGGGEFDLQRVTGGWHAQLGAALARGYDGVRISGNAFWFVKNRWQDFREYEYQLDRSIAGHKMLVLCLYALGTSRAVDVMDVARAHQYSIARRRGEWEWLETPDLKLANQGADGVHRALDVLSNPFPGHDSLTPRERVALAHFVRGASNKEVGRVLGISPRTAEFHRSNIMRKLGAKNSVDLVRRVLGQR
ncbi:MAG TPA: MEDS domain-containing protein, partial [Gammaproteobacteria bacterium]|nr:MEDS domain-containing protein [Gammaproteobacteria bacterium]